MTYTFRTRCELIKHLRALCEFSCNIGHSNLPISDFEIELPSLLSNCLLIKRLSRKYVNSVKIYIAFRTLGFEATTMSHDFKARVTAFQTSLIACYHIKFVDGYYLLEQISLN